MKCAFCLLLAVALVLGVICSPLYSGVGDKSGGGISTGLAGPYIDWNASSGGASILNKPPSITTQAGLTAAIPDLFTSTPVDGHTNGTNLTEAQCTFTTIYNAGQGANAVTLNAPTFTAERNFLLFCNEAQTSHRWRLKAATGQYIYLIGTDGSLTKGSSGGYIGITSPVIGNMLTVSIKKDSASTYGIFVKPISTPASWTQE